MPAYRLYHLDGAGRVDSAEWLEAENDSYAIERALQVPLKAITAELWQGNRRMACFGQDGITSGDDG